MRAITAQTCDTASRIGPLSVWEDRIAAIRASGLPGIAQGVMARWFTGASAPSGPIRSAA